MSIGSRYQHLEYVQESIFLLDSARHIVFGNKLARNRFGSFRIGQDVVHVIRNPKCLELINDTLTGGETTSETISFGQPANGRFNVNLSLFEDVQTNQNLILVSLLDANELVQAETIRSDFVANVSHELRSPLSSIRGFIETLQGSAKDDSEARVRFLELMAQEANRMGRLISDLLSLSAVEAKQRRRPSGNVDIVAISENVRLSFIQNSDRAENAIEVVLHQSVPRIPGDADELTQVARNLIENAFKYSEDNGGVKVTITKRDSVAGMVGPTVVLQVQDFGGGIAPEHLPRLTERFYRVDADRSRDKGGTGLGLAIVKHIVNRHRGRLHIASKVGEGSVFTVYLPIEPVDS